MVSDSPFPHRFAGGGIFSSLFTIFWVPFWVKFFQEKEAPDVVGFAEKTHKGGEFIGVK